MVTINYCPLLRTPEIGLIAQGNNRQIKLPVWQRLQKPFVMTLVPDMGLTKYQPSFPGRTSKEQEIRIFFLIFFLSFLFFKEWEFGHHISTKACWR